MPTVLVTGSLGLIGAACAEFYLKKDYKVIGIDNDSRRFFFGEEASVQKELESLVKYENYTHVWNDIRSPSLEGLFDGTIDMIVHCAAQPSHDWSYKDPKLDFDINAVATLHLLELFKQKCPNALFVFLSTNKVYGDNPNKLLFVENETRFAPTNSSGINELFPVDNCVHSIFGVSKLAADMLVQEYGKNFKLKTVVLRCGCLTGRSHKGAELHGFLAYLAKCVQNNFAYTVYGYKGKQVRDNIHALDLVECIDEIYRGPDVFGEVFNLGGSTQSNISMLEAITAFESLFNKKLTYCIEDTPRKGDHIWYVTDMTKFLTWYPNFKFKYPLVELIQSFAQHHGTTPQN